MVMSAFRAPAGSGRPDRVPVQGTVTTPERGSGGEGATPPMFEPMPGRSLAFLEGVRDAELGRYSVKSSTCDCYLCTAYREGFEAHRNAAKRN